MRHMGTSVFGKAAKRLHPRKLNNGGFIPLILTLLAVLVAVIVLVYLRVLKAQK